MVELVEGGGHLEAHEHDLLHALEADILRPPDEARQVALRLDVAAEAVVPGGLLEERVLLGLALLLGQRRGGQLLLASSSLPHGAYNIGLNRTTMGARAFSAAISSSQ